MGPLSCGDCGGRSLHLGSQHMATPGASLPKRQGRKGYWERFVPTTPSYIPMTKPAEQLTVMSTHLVVASAPGTLWEATGTGWGTAEQEDVGSDRPRWAWLRGRCGRRGRCEAALQRPAGGTAGVAGEASGQRSGAGPLPALLRTEPRTAARSPAGRQRARWPAGRPQRGFTGTAASFSKYRIPIHDEFQINEEQLFGANTPHVLFAVYLEFEFNGVSRILPGNPIRLGS